MSKEDDEKNKKKMKQCLISGISIYKNDGIDWFNVGCYCCIGITIRS